MQSVTYTVVNYDLTTKTEPHIDLRSLERRVHDLINAERAKQGLPELALDSALSEVARAHSSDMASRAYFSHDTPEGTGPTERGNEAGYTCTKVSDSGMSYNAGLGENLAYVWLHHTYRLISGEKVPTEWRTLEGMARQSVEGWMDSLGHRENILRKVFERQGIGLALADDGKVYFTQNFC